ncbi:hypothetical protein GGX14DRAFT_400996 [Mycena pura]|uniref:Uncharacterized protein n=1 Tax=Mycena pura TaxID=153505 RepID=A0AAD6V8J5_9AGAR|nr:hypothetical protein GGX14DRAFT_400996 [Mycena pura]
MAPVDDGELGNVAMASPRPGNSLRSSAVNDCYPRDECPFGARGLSVCALVLYPLFLVPSDSPDVLFPIYEANYYEQTTRMCHGGMCYQLAPIIIGLYQSTMEPSFTRRRSFLLILPSRDILETILEREEKRRRGEHTASLRNTNKEGVAAEIIVDLKTTQAVNAKTPSPSGSRYCNQRHRWEMAARLLCLARVLVAHASPNSCAAIIADKIAALNSAMRMSGFNYILVPWVAEAWATSRLHRASRTYGAPQTPHPHHTLQDFAPLSAVDECRSITRVNENKGALFPMVQPTLLQQRSDLAVATGTEVYAALAGASFVSAMPAPNPQASVPGWPTIKSTAESNWGTGAYNVVANDPDETDYPSYNCAGIATGWIWFEYLLTVDGHFKWQLNMTAMLPNDADRKIGALLASPVPAPAVPPTSSVPVHSTPSAPVSSTPASPVRQWRYRRIPVRHPATALEMELILSTLTPAVNVKSSVPVGAIVGGVLGPILVLMLALWFYCHRRRGARISPGKNIFSVGGISTPAETTIMAVSESEPGMLMKHSGRRVGAPHLVASLQPQIANTAASPAGRGKLERQLQLMALRVAQAGAQLQPVPEVPREEEEDPPDYAAAMAAIH